MTLADVVRSQWLALFVWLVDEISPASVGVSRWHGMTWRESAACLGADPDLFFPNRGDSTRPAKQICRSCPEWVRSECLDYATGAALTTPGSQKFGIWGEKSYRERRRLAG